MKTNAVTINQEFNINNHKKNRNNTPNFGISAGNGVVALMDAIDRGGLAASFTIQDVGGTCIPRTINGLHRNEDVTGKYNYQEATEVALREFITGPSMFAIPMAVLYGAKKQFGSALDVQMKNINGLSHVLGSSKNLISASKLADANTFKTGFYNEVFNNILKSSTSGLSSEELKNYSSMFTKQLIALENAKSKGLIKNMRNIPVSNSREDIMSGMVQQFMALVKKSNGDSTRSFYTSSIKDGEKVLTEAHFGKMLTSMTNYTNDFVKSANKNLKAFDADTIKNFVTEFNKSRIGGRFILNIGLMASVIAFCSIIPKIYIRNKQFPGVNGLVNEQAQAQDNAVTAEKKVENANK